MSLRARLTPLDLGAVLGQLAGPPVLMLLYQAHGSAAGRCEEIHLCAPKR